jgi:hypothetical protein
MSKVVVSYKLALSAAPPRKSHRAPKTHRSMAAAAGATGVPAAALLSTSALARAAANNAGEDDHEGEDKGESPLKKQRRESRISEPDPLEPRLAALKGPTVVVVHAEGAVLVLASVTSKRRGPSAWCRVGMVVRHAKSGRVGRIDK